MKKNIKRMAMLMALLLAVLSCVLPVTAFAVPAEETTPAETTPAETTPAESIPAESILAESTTDTYISNGSVGNFMEFIYLVMGNPTKYTEALKELGDAGAGELTVATAVIAAGLDAVPSITHLVGELKYAAAVWILSIGLAVGSALWGIGKSGLLDLLAKILKGLVKNADFCMQKVCTGLCNMWRQRKAGKSANEEKK